MEFNCNLEDLEALGLTFTQYLILFGLYNNVGYRNITIHEKVYKLLEEKDYIYMENEEWKLTPIGYDFFNPSKSLFDTFIETFPTRVADPMSGAVRILSPAGSKTIAGKKLRKKWDTITKGNATLEQHIIDCLNAELMIRKNAGNMQFMRNIETWLNNGTWEDFEYAVGTKTETRDSNTIKL